MTRKHKRVVPTGSTIAVPKVSDCASRAHWERAVWQAFIVHLTTLQRSAELASILNILITTRERRVLVQRIAAVHRVLSGKSYREIGEELWLTPQTISAIKKSLHEKQYRSYNERGKTARKKRVYSRDSQPKRQHRDPSKRAVRTKYGTLYI